MLKKKIITIVVVIIAFVAIAGFSVYATLKDSERTLKVLNPYPEYKSQLTELKSAMNSSDPDNKYLVYNLTFNHNNNEIKIASDKAYTKVTTVDGLEKPYVIYKYLDKDVSKVKQGFYVLNVVIPTGWKIEGE